ncbi:hypothetical protein BDN67DRAFT_976300 [Paxillus ammoniavirescens]|nr:hypothetical protein BDN67DRAFT_976300 [Paxillus ammoniavirescens]
MYAPNINRSPALLHNIRNEIRIDITTARMGVNTNSPKSTCGRSDWYEVCSKRLCVFFFPRRGSDIHA